MNDARSGMRHAAGLVLAGFLLLSLMLALALISPRFAWGGDLLARPVFLFTGLMLGAGAVWVSAVLLARRAVPSSHMLLLVFCCGLAMRGVLFFSTPVCETDFYRYLWEGCMTAEGYNPYGWPPEAVAAAVPGVPQDLAALGEKAGPILDRINHAHLSSVYPPVAQAAFALAYLLKPWSFTVWRLLLLCCDLMAFGLLLSLLRAANRNPLLIVAYWWSPVLLKESYNAMHMDMLIVPLLLAALLIALRGGYARSLVILAFAAAVKFWPVILAPLLARPLLRTPKRLLAAGLISGLALLFLLLPVTGAWEKQATSGFTAYGRRWEMNDALFMAIDWSVKQGAALAGLRDAVDTRIVTRIITGLLVLGVVAWMCRRPWRNARQLTFGATVITAVLLLLSPTQFPWYAIWLIPLLPLHPRPSLLLFAGLLPLYYLRFHFKARDMAHVFDYGIVWIEHAPVWAAILFECGISYWRRRRKVLQDV
jgi:alpha-1,6-mannosyltransferase